jgi:hypothetical protein
MKSAAFAFSILICVQLVGISLAVSVAAVQIRTILVTGPLCSLVGFVIAFGWKVTRRVAVPVFGLSAIAVSLFLWGLIAGLGWSPGDARRPVPLMLLGYEAIFVPLGLLALYGTLVGPPGDAEEGRWQFKLRTVFAIMFVAAAFCAVSKFMSQLGSPTVIALSFGLLAVTVTGIGVVGFLAFRRLGRGHDMRVEPNEPPPAVNPG